MNTQEIIQLVHRAQAEYEALAPNLNTAAKKTRAAQLHAQTVLPDFWNTPETAQKVSQNLARLNKFIDQCNGIEANLNDLPQLVEIATEDEMKEIEGDAQGLWDEIQALKITSLLGGEYDAGNALLSLTVGNGGQDAEDFTQMLSRMYIRYAEQQGWKVTIVDESLTDVGLKSQTLEITGDYAYGFLQAEHGVHRLIRLSPFNAKSLRQTSFARVEILPEIEQDTDVTIDASDLRIDVFRSSGPGGQSVNTTDSAVRITYLPLGITVSCQNEKSQLQNKAAAMKVLKSRLLQLQLQQQAKEISEIRGDVLEAAFGSQIRTYTLQPYKLVKDHRTDLEHTNPEKVLDGDLKAFAQAFLQQK